MEIFLAKVIGLYLIIMGGLVILRRKSVMPAIEDFAKNRALVFVIAALELAAGLALVVAYPTVEVSLVGLLSLFGWMMIAESIIYVALPSRKVRKMVALFNRSEWYVVGGVLSLLLGIYVAGSAFGYIAA